MRLTINPLFDEIKEMYLKAYYGEAEYAELIGEDEEDEEFVS